MIAPIGYGNISPDVYDIPLQRASRWTQPWEVRWLIAKFRSVPGNICEIGVLDGVTTNELATALPDRTIHAVDLPELNVDYKRMSGGVQIGHFARHHKNVQWHLVGSDKYRHIDETCIFIDGDHSWPGVDLDTDRAFLWFRPMGRYDDLTNAKHGCIVWHDYQQCVSRWSRVYDYLNLRHAEGWPIMHVGATMLAVLDL